MPKRKKKNSSIITGPSASGGSFCNLFIPRLKECSWAVYVCMSAQFRAENYLSYSHYSHINSHQIRHFQLSLIQQYYARNWNSRKESMWHKLWRILLLWFPWLWPFSQDILTFSAVGLHFFFHDFNYLLFVHVYLSFWHRDTAVQSSLHFPQHFSEQQSRWQWLRPGVQRQQILLCLWILSG